MFALAPFPEKPGTGTGTGTGTGFVLGSLLVLLAACPAARPPAPVLLSRVVPYQPAPAPDERAVLAAAGLTPERVGFAVWDVEAGVMLAEHRGDTAFMPASVTKLVSTVASLEVLGAEHVFETALFATGPVRQGVLEGDLVLRGDGDPRFSAADLLSLATQLRRAGVQQVRGRFLYDESALPSAPFIDAKQPLESAYNPPVSALSLESNTLMLHWRPGAAAGEAVGFTVPAFEDVRLVVAPAALPGKVRLVRDAEVETWLLSPAAGPSGSVAVTLRSPALRVAELFRGFALASGTLLPAPEPGRKSDGAVKLVAHASAPLPLLVEQQLSTSDNLMTELIASSAVRKLRGGTPAPSLADVGAALVGWWKQRRPDVDWSAANLQNGSGLSAETRLTPRQVLAVLDEAAKHQVGGRELASLLASGGLRGTLAKRLDTPEASLRVWAKTGTMNFAVGLAGELYPASGRRLRFVVFVNDLDARRENEAQEARGESERAGAAAEAWNARARSAADGLVRRWLQAPPAATAAPPF